MKTEPHGINPDLLRAARAAPSALHRADGGCICGVAPNAGMSAVATVLPVNTPRSISMPRLLAASFEPGETWFYDYRTRKMIPGEKLAEPRWHPEDQPAPGPSGKVPHDWESRLH